MADPIPLAWLPDVRMDRVHLHWTAGTHTPNAVDKKHYHFIYAGDGKRVRGNRSIADNVPPLKAYAAHTRGANSYAIGLSVACMGGPDVREKPFVAGKWPMTRTQFEEMCRDAAQICKRYGIPVAPKTVLWHAEVQGTLGIAQAGKWDATVLAFDSSKKGAKAVGDYTRSVVQAFMEGKRPVAPTPEPIALPRVPREPVEQWPESETAGPPSRPWRGVWWLVGGFLVAAALIGAAVYFDLIPSINWFQP